MTKKLSSPLAILTVAILMLLSCSKEGEDTTPLDKEAFPVEIAVSNKDDGQTASEAALPLNAVISQLTFIAYYED